ncbi:MAG: ATP-binding cassette domain-containing protein [Candidatus Thermoplasmatota archaeon]|nr:ATP-binding cassette domain-containing protein [Candidatus Thermoplasmatota archaeon]
MNVSIAAQSPPIISLQNARFSYEGGVEALRGVSLNVARGENVAIVGGNGSGKTTLAKHLNGLLKPSSGKVLIGGEETSTTSVATLARTVGYVFQNPDYQLFCTSVSEEVRFGPKNMGFGHDDESALAERALKLMGISHLREQSPVSLSLGDRRKVAIASVLATSPRVLVLDEPTTGLDSVESAQLMATLGVLRSEGMTIVLITHDMRLVAQHMDRVIVMSEGRIAFDAGVEEAFSDPDRLKRCKLLAPPITVLAQRLQAQGLLTEGATTPLQLVEQLVRVRGEQQ